MLNTYEKIQPSLGTYVAAQQWPAPCRFALCQAWMLTSTGGRETDVIEPLDEDAVTILSMN